jgi:Membrane-bound lysozyme-inhibitor of c-type lysozyme
MKNKILIIAITACMTFAACEKHNENDITTSPTTTEIEDIDYFSVANNSGAQLDMTFNNSTGKAIFVFNGENIEMQQDTTVSGIKYRNLEYEFEENQGRLFLKKGDKMVFESNN